MQKLLTIRFSHYCDRARWVLDHYEERYEEITSAPMGHIFLVRSYRAHTSGHKDGVSSSYSTPILITDKKELINDSTEICRYVDKKHGGKLFGGQDVEDYIKRVHDNLGPAARYLVYENVFKCKKVFEEMDRNFAGFQRTFFKVLNGFIMSTLKKVFEIRSENTEKNLKLVLDEFDYADALLKDGRPYLHGNDLTISDITFASLAAPVLLISVEEGYGGYVASKDDERLPEDFRNLITDLRKRPAGQHALKLYQVHRGKPQIPLKPDLSGGSPITTGRKVKSTKKTRDSAKETARWGEVEP